VSNRTKVVTLSSRKGGVGKTTCTGILARYFSEVEGKNVVVIDLDPLGGISSLLGVKAGEDDLSISEVIQIAGDQTNFQDAFRQAIFDTGLSNSKDWLNNGGKLFLLPSKFNLDTVLANNHFSLLGMVIRETPLPDNVLILIDTGTSSESIRSGIYAADVVFVPLIMSRLDIPPLFEMLKFINLTQRQRENNNPAIGGFIINCLDDTQREEEYVKQYVLTLEEYLTESKLSCVSDDLFFFLKTLPEVRWSTYFSGSLRKEFKLFSKKLADNVHQA